MGPKLDGIIQQHIVYDYALDTLLVRMITQNNVSMYCSSSHASIVGGSTRELGAICPLVHMLTLTITSPSQQCTLALLHSPTHLYYTWHVVLH